VPAPRRSLREHAGAHAGVGDNAGTAAHFATPAGSVGKPLVIGRLWRSRKILQGNLLALIFALKLFRPNFV
jgi:hypothetical protein